MLRSEHRAPDGAPSITALARWSSGRAEADLQFLALDHLGPGDGRTMGMVMVALMDVASRGTVSLVDDDPMSDPIVELRMLSDPGGEDERRLRIGLEGLLRLLDTPAMSAVADAVYLDDQGTTPQMLTGRDVGDFLRRNLADYVHPVGTCAMGLPDDPMAVVDPDGHVIGHEALSVCDASIIPVLPRANTHLPVTIVAEAMARRWTTASRRGGDITSEPSSRNG
jgi:choline dehydrogenase-like flavoprotein